MVLMGISWSLRILSLIWHQRVRLLYGSALPSVVNLASLLSRKREGMNLAKSRVYS